MDIFALTPLGKAIARSTRSPDSPEWKVIHHLDLMGHATRSQIQEYCGLGDAEVTAALVKLRHKKVVIEETGTEV